MVALALATLLLSTPARASLSHKNGALGGSGCGEHRWFRNRERRGVVAARGCDDAARLPQGGRTADSMAIVERERSLSSLTTEDAIAYRSFLRRPLPRERWVGPPRPLVTRVASVRGRAVGAIGGLCFVGVRFDASLVDRITLSVVGTHRRSSYTPRPFAPRMFIPNSNAPLNVREAPWQKWPSRCRLQRCPERAVALDRFGRLATALEGRIPANLD